MHVAVVLVAQSCVTLCDSMDSSPAGSLSHGILQARILERVAILFPEDLTQSEIQPAFPALQAGSLPSEPPRKPVYIHVCIHMCIQTHTHHTHVYVNQKRLSFII